MAKTGRFWRNVVLIALAHVALIAVLIRWSLAARASSNPESIVWLGGAGDLAAGESANEPALPAKHASASEEPKPSKEDETQEQRPVVTAKSEIELSSPTPKPTPKATATPKPAATPAPKSRSGGTTPKPIPKPTAKKKLVAKASPKPSPKAKSSSEKASDKPEKSEKKALTKNKSESQGGTGNASPDRSGQSDAAGGGSSASEFGWYGNMLHDRFYSAWIQPTTNVPSDSKFSTLVKVRIEKDGHVSKFEIVKPSRNVVVNESVRVVAKQVTQVDAPPTGLIKGDHYDVKINFELNTGEQ